METTATIHTKRLSLVDLGRCAESTAGPVMFLGAIKTHRLGISDVEMLAKFMPDGVKVSSVNATSVDLVDRRVVFVLQADTLDLSGLNDAQRAEFEQGLADR